MPSISAPPPVSATPAGQVSRVAAALDLDPDDLQDLLHTRLNDLCQCGLTDALVGTAGDAGNENLLILRDSGRKCRSELAFQVFRLVTHDT